MKILTTEDELDVFAPAMDGMSEEEFYHFCQANPDTQFERDKDGAILIMSPIHFKSGRFESIGFGELYRWNFTQQLGTVLSPSTGFTLPSGAVRSPDAAWISNTKLATLTEAEQERFAHICPEFVMEIRSKTDNIKTLQTKIQEYIDNGAQLGFLIDPYQQKAYVYAPNKEAVIADNFQQKLSGGTLLPGFELDLSLFLL